MVVLVPGQRRGKGRGEGGGVRTTGRDRFAIPTLLRGCGAQRLHPSPAPAGPHPHHGGGRASLIREIHKRL